MIEPVYLDYNATAPLCPEALAAMTAALAVTGNASSPHGFGRRARRLVEDAREQVASFVGARPEQLVFTGGGTEANNQALRAHGRPRVLVSAGEHASVLQAVPEVVRVPLRRDGVVSLAKLASLLAGDTAPAIVSLQLANNETGVIQPVAEAAALAREFGALVHCDAVQAAGKIPVDFALLGVDLMSLSAHKLGGPQGIGALVVADDVALQPFLLGGGQERGRRAGTENVAAIAGFGAAAAVVRQTLAHLEARRDAFEVELRGLAPSAVIFGAEAPRLPNTTCLALPGLTSESQLMALDLAGIAVSSGSACSSGKVAPSHVLGAMGASTEEAKAALRISTGWASGDSDYARFLEAWRPLAQRFPVTGSAVAKGAVTA
ncbi:cysteine desulfurase family protein [Algihabitans albus]|uniref:cysteine desulfurase family protein n=1 Tax=Algihabitans albus TaxID=2164067 RepID=UPI000E5D231D|nr:cysteine desulfurase family protein [Algihabitans albus]